MRPPPDPAIRQKGNKRSMAKKQMTQSRETRKNRVESSLRERPSRSRSMKVLVDGEGNPWICDCEADPSRDLAEEGCWQHRDEGSTQSKERRSGQKQKKDLLSRAPAR